MPDEDDIPAKDRPQIRLLPSVARRIQHILNCTGDRSPLAKIVNDLLVEALNQIESAEASPPAMITLHRLRHAVGNDKLSPPMDEVLRRLSAVEETLRERLDTALDEHERASRKPPKKKQAARRRAA